MRRSSEGKVRGFLDGSGRARDVGGAVLQFLFRKGRDTTRSLCTAPERQRTSHSADTRHLYDLMHSDIQPARALRKNNCDHLEGPLRQTYFYRPWMAA